MERLGIPYESGIHCSGCPNHCKTIKVTKIQNVISFLSGGELKPLYDGYGSCPLTVENGKIILAEFGYGGQVMPTFPWDSTKARRSAWFLKKSVLPAVYWRAMLKGREWLARPEKTLPTA